MKKIILLGLCLLATQIIFSQNITITSDDGTTVDEGNSFTLTATSEVVSDADIIIPLSIAGNASSGLDYTVSFSTQGSESILTTEAYGNKLEILPDGQYLMWTFNVLKILNPTTLTYVTYDLNREYQRIKPFGNAFYASTENALYLLEIDENNLITETLVEQLSDGFGFNYHFYISGNSIIYQVVRYDNGIRWLYVKQGDDPADEIYTGEYCCFTPIIYNGKYYMIETGWMYEIIDGEFTDYKYFGNSNSINRDRIKEFNGKLYVSNYDYASNTEKVSIFDPTTGSFADIDYQTQQEYSNYDFIFNNENNLVVLSGAAPTLYKYQFSPQFSIAAGETSATILFQTTPDNSDEADETINITPGVPSSGSLSDTSPLNITITDDDDSAAVTFTLSSENLVENSNDSVTLTATSTPVSGQEITIPILLSGTASSDRYTLSATEIIIPANSSSGMISISAVNNEQVEVLETIIITPGTIINGTTLTTELTLNLLSEDNPTGTLASSSLEVTEGGIATVTLEVNSATSQDIIVPVELTGTAVFNQDYTTQFDTQGDESLIANLSNNYNNLEVLGDGRYIYGSGNNRLNIYDPITKLEETYEINFDGSYIGINSFSVSESSIFINGNNRITKLNTNDLVPNSNDNQISVTSVFDGTNLGTNDYLEGNYVSSENETVIYQVRDYPTGWKIYKKTGDSPAETIYDGDQYAQQLFILNDRVYKYDSYNIRELYNGEYTQSISYSSYLMRIKTHNGLAYAFTEQNNTRKIVKLSIEEDIINSGSGTIIQLPYVLGDTHDYTYDFSLDISGNLIMQNRVFENDNFNYGIYKYQLFPEIVIPAGSTSANLSLLYTDDLSNEESETIIVTPVNVENVEISTASLELTILDDDDEPTITFEFSSESINENSTESVTLTATSNIASGIEITIPFTLDESTASSDEYIVSDNEIVIPANQTSASITISPGTNDTDVEITETIVFTFGEIVNASTQQQSITLNLESDDNPNLVSLLSSPIEIEEGESSQITATIDEATSNDVFLPILLGGTAIENIDYETEFVSRGEQSLTLGLSNSSYTRFGILPDGRYVYWNDGSTFVVYDPVSEITETATNFPGNDFRFMRIIGDNIYIAGWGGISSVDISNISSGSVNLNTIVAQENNINVTNISGFQPNTEIDVMVYTVDDNDQNRRRIYEKEIGGGNNNSTLLYETTDYPAVIKRDNKVFVFTNYRFYELVNGVLTNQKNYITQSNQEFGIEWSDNNSPKLINGNIYVRGLYENFGNIYKLEIESGNLELLNYTVSNNINYTWDYDFSPDGNLLFLNSYSDDENNNYRGIFSYLQTLQVKILAGQLTGSVAITAIDDDSFEPIETISVTAGTPFNAILDSSIETFEIEILNNDTEPSVTYEFSSESILESSITPVQLTATLSAISSFDVTIPFTTSAGSAEANEFSVVDTEILIVAGETSASIDILANDDTEVEILETIIFTFGDIIGGISQQETAILNLISDDLATVNSLASSEDEIQEDGTFELTASINLPTSEDILIPINFSGTALKDIDYTVTAESIGQESFISIFEEYSGYDSRFDILADGRFIVIDNQNGTKISIYDPITGVTVSDSYNNYIQYLAVDENDIYVANGSSGIFKLDISDIENGEITQELAVDTQSLGIELNGYQFSVEDGTILFNTRNPNQTWIKNGPDATPVVLTDNANECCMKPMLVDGDIYQFEYWWYKKYNQETGEFSDNIQYGYDSNGNQINLNREKKLVALNGDIYIFNNNGDLKKLTPQGNILLDIDYTLSSLINSISSFDFDASGNLITVNNFASATDANGNATSTSWGFFSYNQNPSIKISAGNTSGSISFIGVDDDSFEASETILSTLLTPSNAIIEEELSNEVIILNNDAEPTIIFDFSSESIFENSTTPVQLTATLSYVSAFDVTIPFTTNAGSAEADEFTVVDTEILIAAGEISSSIDILANDDTEVEFSETIIFTFGDITGGTSQQETAILNLLSDDDPSLVSLVADPIEFAEHESTLITATIDLPTSEDVFISMNFSGTAEQEVDYNVISESIGQESFISIFEEYSGQYESRFGILADGRYIVIDNQNGTKISIYDPITGVTVSDSYNNYIQYLAVDENDIYVANGSSGIFKLDISDIENGEITQELAVDTQSLGIELNGYQFSVEDGTILFNTRNPNQTWIKNGPDATPVVLTDNANDCCMKPMLVDGDIYQFEYWWFKKYNQETGEYSEEQYYLNENLQSYYNGFNRDRKLATNNGEVYYYSDSGEVFKLNLESFVYSPANFIYSDQINSSSSFDFDINGDLIMLNNYTTSTDDNGNATSTSWGFFSYNQNPRVKVAAGETSGSIIINGIEDELNSPGEETDETIDISFSSTENLVVDDANLLADINLTILNNEISINEDLDALANVPALTSSSIAWGDYDRDGDQDLAIMGYNGDFGVLTRLYENNNGVFELTIPEGTFTKKYLGDIMWVDYNKDGYVDLVVSGLDVNDEPSTTIYKNNEGVSFSISTELILPDLFNTTIDSGDLDNDGDIDFVIAGFDENNEWKKFIYFREQNSLVKATNYNGQFDESGYDFPQLKIGDLGFDGDLDIFYIGENGGFIKNNTLINNSDNYEQYLSGYKGVSMELFGSYLYFMGEDNDGNYRFNRINLQSNNEDQYPPNIEGLKNGDIAIADYNNDGLEDILITGENSIGESITKLYEASLGTLTVNEGAILYSENTDVTLIGLRESTAKWVDYDTDGDLDLFITGTSDSGDFNKLYKTDQLNKTNEASTVITDFAYESLGNGKVRLSWTAPEDDFSDSLGYILRLGTSEGGSELANTESNLETGQRLITKSPVIYSNSYEIQLNPGNYYWAVQSVDTGLKGSVFSEEQSFQLTYEWKLLNQGGIIDQSISAQEDPIVKLSDIDGDNDMDLVYGSSSNNNDISVFSLNGNKFDYLNNLNNSRNISGIAFFDFNNDFVLDILVNTWQGSDNNSFKLYNSQGEGNFNEVFNTSGLFDAKIELIDIDNDGSDEIILIGRTSSAANSQLKVLLYQQEGTTIGSNPLDISSQVSSLKNASSAFGDIDNDEDIDFAITGSSNSGTQSKVYFNDTEYEDSINPIFTLSDIDFDRVTSSTLDFVDFDADGDLDLVVTGNAVGVGVIFKILINNGLQGTELAFEEMPNSGLIPIREAKLDFGDYNGDGYLDILYTGVVSGSGKITKLVEYSPEDETFIDSNFDLSDIVDASIAFGDVDGDNDLDFTIAGESISGNNNTIKTYLNVRNESAEVISDALRTRSMFTVTNDDSVVYLVNDKPSIPTNLISEDLGYDPVSDTHKVKFRWDASEDDNTPTKGLTYSLRVGTTPGGDEVMKVNALSNGYRLSAGKGNVEHNKEWTLNLPNNQYYWSVQAIDASFSGSVFSNTQTSVTLGVKNQSLDMVESYPNPMRDFYMINSPYSLSLKIYDLTGKLISTHDLISGSNQIDTSKLAAGTYIFNMKSDRAIKSILVIKD